MSAYYGYKRKVMKVRKILRAAIAAAALCQLLAGCSTVKSTLGVGANESPDEFSVVAYPPLVVPPTFDLQNIETEVEARSALTPRITNKYTPNDKLFLAMVRANLEPDAMTETGRIMEEKHRAEKKGREEKGYIRSTLHRLNHSSTDEAIDAEFEAERIFASKQEGKPINEGKIRTQKSSKSTLSRLFGW